MEKDLQNNSFGMQHSLFRDEASTVQEINAAGNLYFENTKGSCIEEEVGKHKNDNVQDYIDDQNPEPEDTNALSGTSCTDCEGLPFENSSQVLQWFQDKNLIKNELRCESCSHWMKWTKQPQSIDGFDWRCRNDKCVKFRVNCKSIRHGSFFAKSKMSLPKWFDIMFLWSKHVGVTEASEQMDITRSTIATCYRFFKEVCGVYIKSNPIKLGGPGIMLDIDVFTLTKKKKCKGGLAISIFCIVDSNCSPSIGYMEIVEKMDVNTLFPLILKVVESGSVIHTRDWREYCKIKDFADRDGILIPSISFVDVSDKLHKENIESYRNNHKSSITTMFGFKRNLLNSYLQEFMWRERFMENTLESLCEHIAFQFSDGKCNDSTNDFFQEKETEQQKHLEQITKNCFEVEQKIQSSNDTMCYTENRDPESKIENPSDEISLDCHSSHSLCFKDTSNILQWFQEKRLIKTELKCESCTHLMKWTIQPKSLDGYDWRCRNKKCVKFRVNCKSIRYGSIFAKSKISLPKWFDIMFLWSKHVGGTEASEQMNISRKTITTFFTLFREVCEVYFKSNPIKLGGPSVTLDIDVFSLTQKNKCRGELAFLIFCIVDSNCSPSIGYMEIVEKTDVAILFPIIQKVVKPGSIIHTKDWREYLEILTISDSEKNMNPCIHFVDVNAGVHKENTELYANKHRSVITAMSGCKRNLVNMYLQEFMWRERFMENTLESLCEHIALQFSDGKYNDSTNDFFPKKETEQQKHLEGNTKSCLEVEQKIQSSNDTVGYTENTGPESKIKNPSDEISLNCRSSQSLFFKDTSNILQWFQEKRMIKTELKCESCSHWMKLTIQPKSLDGYDWRCRNKKCVKFRVNCKSVRYGSVFAKSKMSLPKWFDIMFLWSKHVGVTEASEQMNISRKTIATCYTLFKEACEVYFKSNPIKLGGPRVILDIDIFSLTQKNKCRGELAFLIFCIVDSNCNPSIGYMEIVEKTDFSILFPIIQKVVKPGSIIHTKDWREYFEILTISDSDNIMNPSIHFVDVNAGVHTKNIELYVNKHRSIITAMSGCKRNMVNSYLQEFMWRERFNDNTLESLCKQIVDQFSDEKYTDRFDNSFIKEKLVQQKHQDISTDSENTINCIGVEINEDANCLGEPPYKKSCY